MSQLRKLEYLLLLLVGSSDVDYLNTKILTKPLDKLTQLSKYLKSIQEKLEGSVTLTEQRKLMKLIYKGFRNYVRVFLIATLSLHKTASLLKIKGLEHDHQTILQFANSMGLLLSLNPIIKQITSFSKYSNSVMVRAIIPNLISCFLSFVKYPSHPMLQKHYLSIYSSVLFLEHGFKLLEKSKTNVGLRRLFQISSQYKSGQFFMKMLSNLTHTSWILFPICYSKIFKYFILENESCPKYFLRALEYLTAGLFPSNVKYSVPTIIKYKETLHLSSLISDKALLNQFIFGYLPDKLSTLFKVSFPLLLLYNYRSMGDSNPINLIQNSAKGSLKIVVAILGLVSSSVYSSYFVLGMKEKEFIFSKWLNELSKSKKLQLVGFVTGLITYFFKTDQITNKDSTGSTTTYRSIWLYVLRLTLISSTRKHSLNNTSKFNHFKIDKLLIILSFAGLLSIDDIYKSQKVSNNQISYSSQKSLKLLLNLIKEGSVLVK